MMGDIDAFIDVVNRWNGDSSDTWLQGMPVAMSDIHGEFHILARQP